MSELIYMLAFVFGQVVFLPSYLKCTKLLTKKEKLSIGDIVKYISISPLSVYIISSVIFAISVKAAPWIEAAGADVVAFILSVLCTVMYQHMVTKNGNRVLGIYIYISFYLFQSSFTYVFDNIWFIIFDQILLTSILSAVIYKMTKKYIKTIEQDNLKMTTENKGMLVVPLSAIAIKLTQSVVYSIFIYSNVNNNLWNDGFSVYNAAINTIVLAMVVCFTEMTLRTMARQTQLAAASDKYNELSKQSLRAMVHAIEAKDVYTNGHSIRVAEYSEMIARKMGYSDGEAKGIYMMALVHDIGKIGIEDEIINKPGKLTDEEYAKIKNHPEIGARILQEVEIFGKTSEIALCHHEREDGKGYPRGLKGDEISIESAIVSVADAYDAMTSRRSYRDIMPQEIVKTEIKNEIGKQFKREPAETMLEIIDADVSYKLHQEQ